MDWIAGLEFELTHFEAAGLHFRHCAKGNYPLSLFSLSLSYPPSLSLSVYIYIYIYIYIYHFVHSNMTIAVAAATFAPSDISVKWCNLLSSGRLVWEGKNKKIWVSKYGYITKVHLGRGGPHVFSVWGSTLFNTIFTQGRSECTAAETFG